MKNIKEVLENHRKWLLGEGGVRANLSGADLSGVNLSYVNLSYANLSGADLRGANLSDANLRGADLSGVKVNYLTVGYWLTCPETGEFTAYKKCKNSLIVTLKIPADAERSSATTRKCRASKAIILDIEDSNGNKAVEAVSNYDDNFIYRIGETVEVDDYDYDRWNKCSSGIHFFMSKDEAKLWN